MAARVRSRATEGQVPGGIVPGKGGGDATRTRIALSPLPGGTNRMVRISCFTVSGGPIRTSGTVEIV
jgi:hypothetical protein